VIRCQDAWLYQVVWLEQPGLLAVLLLACLGQIDFVLASEWSSLLEVFRLVGNGRTVVERRGYVEF
jgi:hypothetical protein